MVNMSAKFEEDAENSLVSFISTTSKCDPCMDLPMDRAKQDVFVKHGCPRPQKKSKYDKNLQVLHFDPDPPPGARDVSEV